MKRLGIEERQRKGARAAWFFAIFFAQIALLWSVARPKQTWSAPPTPPPRLLIADAGARPRSASDRFSSSARTLFSSPHPAGFTGDAWSRISQRPRPEAALVSPPPYLAGSAERLGESFAAWHAQHGEPAFVLAGKPRPSPLRDSQISRPDPSAPAIRIPQGFADREIVRLPAPPAIQHTNVLDPTVVRIGVDLDGRVVSKRLIESSQWADADKEAFRLIEEIQFGPRPPGARPAWDAPHIEWGTVSIPWVVSPPAILDDDLSLPAP